MVRGEIAGHALIITATAIISSILTIYVLKKRSQKKSVCTLNVCTTCSITKRDPTRINSDGTKHESGKQMLGCLTEALQSSSQWVCIEENLYRENETGKLLRVNPMKCFSACSKACNLSIASPEKYQYHFGMLDPARSRDIEDLVCFAAEYVKRDDAVFTKSGERPESLRKDTTMARMPPTVPAVFEKQE